MFDLIALPAALICATYAYLAYQTKPTGLASWGDLVAWAHIVVPGAAAVLATLAAVF